MLIRAYLKKRKMNREIKFRAWRFGDFDEKGTMTMINSMTADKTFNFAYENPFDIVLMQNTGLKDKNGKEIYEGDIVREDFRSDGSFYSTGIIEFYEGSFGSRNEHDRFRIPALFSGKAVEGMNLNYYEVIGNIHENPELL